MAALFFWLERENGCKGAGRGETGLDRMDQMDQMDAFHVGRALASSLLQVLRGRGVAAQRSVFGLCLDASCVHTWTIEFPMKFLLSTNGH